jgi:cytoskeletal protein CcmA (bactofilin family)
LASLSSDLLVLPATLIPSAINKEHLMGDPYDTSAERTSVLGPTLRFKGELHADEELLIRGQIEGSITHSQRITVCGEGIVKANIRAQTIVVEGTVEGDLQAEKSVQIKETARLKGNVQAPSVSIIEGAQFNGGVAMDATKRAAGVNTNTHAGRSKADAVAK